METKAFTLEGYPLAKAMKLARRRGMPRGVRWAPLFLVLGALLLLTLPTLLHKFGLIDPRMAAWLPLVALALLWVGVLRFRSRSVTGVVAQAPILTGRLQVRLSDGGVILQSDLARHELTWAAISDIVPGPDGLLLITPGVSFFPIPSSAFASPAEMEAFTAAIRARIPVVKEPF
ncbi:YcxB family protein [Stagnihabitans tardus]|uniref:YcxB-like C-terminal domain-containing protein n=1 Tax=Stagnihabitans tardus TaxID=2699202 RepID=A0AAE5BUB4_9RHOB|nr:YcxB family protein [Stagnihabitans tardus]NBZ87067.1 hypothetical protein [Stagnihabitans tardus]